MKILIAISELNTKAGAQRVALKMALALKPEHEVDILAGLYDQNKTFKEFKEFKVKELGIKRKRNYIIQLLYLIKKFKQYKCEHNLIIAHDFPSTALAKKNKNIIWYCHTPPRLIYDLNKKYVKNLPYLIRPLAKIFTSIIISADKKNVRKIKKIIVNSQNVKKRVKKFYNRNSVIIYPGTEDVTSNKFIFKNYLLSVSRLYPEKNVNKIVLAMKEIKDFDLKIVGVGPEYKKIKKVIKKQTLTNVFLEGTVSEKKLKKLFQECYCTIYIPENEDFGLIPIESNSYGKMCVGLNQGGLKETITNLKNGILIPNTEAKEIKKAIYKIKKINKKTKIDECLKNANKFSWSNFDKKIKKEIERKHEQETHKKKS